MAPVPLQKETSLGDLADLPIWVAWRAEQDDRKMPFNPRTLKWAKADDPNTWAPRATAEAAAKKLLIKGFGPKPIGGLGIQLYGIGDGLALGGVDLDTCRTKQGDLTPWAQAVLALIPSYAEVSPSGTGVKVFFRYRAKDIRTFLTAVKADGEGRGKKWALPGSGNHPPSIELYLAGRYFTVTGEQVSATSALSIVSAKQMAELGTLAQKYLTNVKPEGPKDESRSALAFRYVLDLRRRDPDFTFDKMGERLEGAGNPLIVEWYNEKGTAHELRNLWKSTEAKAEELREGDKVRSSLGDFIEDFNERYMVVSEGGKALVYESQHDVVLNRKVYVPISFEDFKKLYMNRFIPTGGDDYKTYANAWLGHDKRRQYLGGILFDPTGKYAREDQLNLWRGFGFTPQPGSWALMREHIRKIVCCGNEEHFTFLMKTLARMVQHPGTQGEVAIVMQGKEGVGKGLVANTMIKLFGQHGFQIANAEHLIGRFNGHLQDCVVLFADEAFYAGDKKHTGILKQLITDNLLFVEDKHKRAFQAKNCIHLIMASNEDWVVPVSIEARRFFVLKVSEERMGDIPYFDAIASELESGGYAAMLYDLMNEDLTGFNHRAIPSTDGLIEQKKLSLGLTDQWWFDILMRGYVYESDTSNYSTFHQWYLGIPTDLIWASYSNFLKNRKGRGYNREGLGAYLKELGILRGRRLRGVVVGETKDTLKVSDRAWIYEVGRLEVAQRTFCEKRNISIEWDGTEADDPEPCDVPHKVDTGAKY
jgi:hypothetical protein